MGHNLSLHPLVDHFTVVCVVAWPLNKSEAGDELFFLQKPPCIYVNDAVLMLIRRNLHKKSSEVSVKTRSTTTSVSFKG